MTSPAHVVAVGTWGPLGLDALSMVMAAKADLLEVTDASIDDKRGVPFGLVQTKALPPDLYGRPRLLRLAAGALAQVARPGCAPIPIFLAMAEPERVQGDMATFLADVGRRADVAVAMDRSRVVREGRAAGVVAVAEALRALEAGSPEVIVGGVDSYLDPPALRALDAACRVHGPDTEDGFIPSEAAAFVRLSARPASSDKARIVDLELGECAVADEPNTGVTMTRILHALAGRATRPVQWIMTDGNNELGRTEEWSWARMRERSLARATETSLARAFGDVGAASAVLAIVVAAIEWSVSKRTAPRTLLAAFHSDGPRRAALSMEAAG